MTRPRYVFTALLIAVVAGVAGSLVSKVAPTWAGAVVATAIILVFGTILAIFSSRQMKDRK